MKKPRADELVIIAPDRKKHHDEMFDLISKVFAHAGGYYPFLDYCLNGYIDGSSYDWKNSRIGLVDGKIVTHYGVWDYQMRIGSARMRVGGIGVVATDAEYRKMGLMARTIDATLEAMRRDGYDFSMLFGISDFYHKFGYIRAWSHLAYIADVNDLPQEPPAALLAKFTPKHREDLAELYNRENAGFTGSAVRPTYWVNRNPKKWQGYLWTGKGGRPTGYVIVAVNPDNIECMEAVGDVEQVLRSMVVLARKSLRTTVRFAPGFPYQSELAKRLRRGNCRAEMRYHRCGGAMVRTVNLAQALQKMAGELSARLGRSHLAKWRGELGIADGREEANLKIAGGKATVVPPGATRHEVRGGDEIAQLLIGTDEPAEVMESAGTKLSGDASELVAVLFPNQHPTLAVWDRY